MRNRGYVGICRASRAIAYSVTKRRNVSDKVRARDEELYGGWKSYDILMEEKPQKEPLHKRWDWHAWQFLVSLLPAGAILAGAHIIESGRQHIESTHVETVDKTNELRVDRDERIYTIQQQIESVERRLQELQQQIQQQKHKDQVEPERNSTTKQNVNKRT